MALERIGATVRERRLTEQEVNQRVSTKEQLRALQITKLLDDPAHKEIYLSLCKRFQEGLIEEALRFVVDSQAKSKAKLFMWKVKSLRQEWLAAGKQPQREVIMNKRKKKKVVPADLFGEVA